VHAALKHIDDRPESSFKQRTKGILFLGTPHGGSPFAMFGVIQAFMNYWVGSNTKNLDALHANHSKESSLDSDFNHIYRTHEIYNFVEGQREYLGPLALSEVGSPDSITITQFD
jgi:hypothetical protein